jgi:hypothetical protein
MKAKIATIFETLRFTNARMVQALDEGESTVQLLSINFMLEEALRNCQMEIELPVHSEEVLVPFLSMCMMSPVNAG